MPQVLKSLALKNLPVAFLRRRLPRATPHVRTARNSERQLLIDLSVITERDAGTGIQRVVRNLYHELLLAPPVGYRVCPVAATRKHTYCYLPIDCLQQPVMQRTITTPVPVEIHAGDVFLGLDLAAQIIPHRLGDLMRWKRRGVRMHFFVYDLLPVREPAWFNPGATRNFKRWLRAIALLGDGVITISRVVEADFLSWMKKLYGLDGRNLPCTTIQPGAELNTDDGKLPMTTVQLAQLHWVKCGFVLMVGTIEPRKGHADVLDAFDRLWAEGDRTMLVIAGRQGWKVETFVKRLQNHSEAGKLLHWLESPDDDTLLRLYRASSGVIMASRGEGFGLPIIEAAYFNKPVLVRDIPVFREIAGNSASYFSNTGPDNLIQALPLWLNQLGKTAHAPLMPASWITWQESCRQLVQGLLSPVPAPELCDCPSTPGFGEALPASGAANRSAG